MELVSTNVGASGRICSIPAWLDHLQSDLSSPGFPRLRSARIWSTSSSPPDPARDRLPRRACSSPTSSPSSSIGSRLWGAAELGPRRIYSLGRRWPHRRLLELDPAAGRSSSTWSGYGCTPFQADVLTSQRWPPSPHLQAATSSPIVVVPLLKKLPPSPLRPPPLLPLLRPSSCRRRHLGTAALPGFSLLRPFYSLDNNHSCWSLDRFLAGLWAYCLLFDLRKGLAGALWCCLGLCSWAIVM